MMDETQTLSASEHTPRSEGVALAVGVAAWLAYMTYLVGFGRAAAAQGFTGELGEVERAADRSPDPDEDRSVTAVPSP